MSRLAPWAILGAVCIPLAWGDSEPPTHRVEVSAEVHGLGMTPAEGRREALFRAREKAVASVAGVEVSAQQLRLRSDGPRTPVDAFSSLVRTSTHGRIVAEEVSYETLLVDDIPLYRASLKAEVALEQGRPDPGFFVEITTRPASHTLRSGERVVIEVTPSRSCYVTLLNVLGDGSVALLFPRAGGPVAAPAGRTFEWPGGRDGYELEVRLPEGRSRDHEQIVAVATLDPIPFLLETRRGETVESGELVRETAPGGALTALNRWLVRIPADRRAEALWSYEVVE